MPRHMTCAERDECVRLYLVGTTLDRLSEIFNRDRCTIGRLVARRAVKRGDKFRHMWRCGGRPLSQEHRERIRAALLRRPLTNRKEVVK